MSVLPYTEVLIRYIRREFPGVSIFFFESVCWDTHQPYHDGKVSITAHYQTPLFSYRNTIGNTQEKCENENLWGREKHHPPASVSDVFCFVLFCFDLICHSRFCHSLFASSFLFPFFRYMKTLLMHL